ncbi:MAG: sigma factor [Pseudomonadota bacterium]
MAARLNTTTDALAGTVLETEMPKLRHYIAAELKYAATAEDLGQELWIRAARNADKAVDAGGPYLWRIAKSLVADYLRGEARRLTAA